MKMIFLLVFMFIACKSTSNKSDLTRFGNKAEKIDSKVIENSNVIILSN